MPVASADQHGHTDGRRNSIDRSTALVEEKLQAMPFEPDVAGQGFIRSFAGEGDDVAGGPVGGSQQQRAYAGGIHYRPFGTANHFRVVVR